MNFDQKVQDFMQILVQHWGNGQQGYVFERTANSEFPYDVVLEEVFYSAWKNGFHQNQNFQIQTAAEFLAKVPKQIEKDTEIGRIFNFMGTEFIVFWNGQKLEHKPA